MGAPQPDISSFLSFLQRRRRGDGTSGRAFFGEPEPRGGGTWRLPVVGFDEAALPEVSQAGGHAQWVTAYHGCKLEALYSIVFHGALDKSEDTSRGDRFLADATGVYIFREKVWQKAWGYSRFVPLLRDGCYWCCVWELRVDRTDNVRLAHADQWVQKPRSTRLAAL
ncbi:MAG: hypothetical protein GY772_19320, partial [bacterium]|nr:hypothetical protein [bacterium]